MIRCDICGGLIYDHRGRGNRPHEERKPVFICLNGHFTGTHKATPEERQTKKETASHEYGRLGQIPIPELLSTPVHTLCERYKVNPSSISERKAKVKAEMGK